MVLPSLRIDPFVLRAWLLLKVRKLRSIDASGPEDDLRTRSSRYLHLMEAGIYTIGTIESSFRMGPI